MKLYKYLFIFILLCSSAWGALRTSCTDTIEITSLPYTLGYSDTCYCIKSDLSSASTGITVGNKSGFLLTGENHTITYNTGETNGSNEDNLGPVGLYIYSCYDALIKDITFTQYSGTGRWGTACRFQGTRNSKFDNVSLHPKGANCKGIFMMSQGNNTTYNMLFDGGNWSSYVDSFDSRCLMQATVATMRSQSNTIDSSQLPGNYTWEFRHITIDSMPHIGFNLEAAANGSISIVDSCTIYCDAHNDTYSRPSGVTCHSADNPYAIRLSRPLGGTKVFDNTIRNRTTHEGGRGILVEAASGTAGNYVEIYNNDVDVSNGPSDYEGATGGVWVFRSRQNTDNGIPNRYMKVYNNIFKGTADTLTSTTHIGPQAFGVYFSDCGEYASNDSLGESCFVYNNTIEMMADSNNFDNGVGNVAGMNLELLGQARNKFYYNHIKTNGIPYWFGGGNSGSKHALMVEDTLEWVSPYYGNDLGHGGLAIAGSKASANPSCDSNNVRDPYFTFGTEDSVDYANSQATKSILFDVTLTLTVNGNDGLPVQGASAWAVNKDGDTLLSGTTDINGQVSGYVNYIFKYWNGTTASHTNYNPFAIGANKATDTTEGTYTIAWNNKDTTLVLTNTGGESAMTTTIKGIRITGGRF